VDNTNILAYLSGFAKIMPAGKQRDFYTWQRKVARKVKIKSYKSDKKLKKIVEDFLVYFKPQYKECYYTAYKLALECKEIEYVEGHAISIIPLSHGWNCYKGIHFDLSNEILNLNIKEYAKVIQLGATEKKTIALLKRQDFRVGDFIGGYYQLYVEGEKNGK